MYSVNYIRGTEKRFLLRVNITLQCSKKMKNKYSICGLVTLCFLETPGRDRVIVVTIYKLI